MKPLMIVHPGMMAALCSLNLAVDAPSNVRRPRPCPRSLYPRLACFLGLIIVAGMPACGPAVSDQSTSGLPAMSQQTPSPRNKPFGSSATAVSLAAPSAANYAAAPVAQEEPAPLPENLVLPDWIEQALEAPESRVRLQALDLWSQEGVQVPLDPLIVALDDEDENVRTKAMALIEWRWAVEQAAEAGAAK
jgi:hypothetical protein